jgi:hypothetical protein
MSGALLRVACIGMGWWSDVLADAIKRSGKLKIMSCFSRSDEKRQKFTAKYGGRASPSFEAILADPEIEAIINTTPKPLGVRPTFLPAADFGRLIAKEDAELAGIMAIIGLKKQP